MAPASDILDRPVCGSPKSRPLRDTLSSFEVKSKTPVAVNNNYLSGAESLIRSSYSLSYLTNSSPFIESEGLFPCSE